MNPWISFAWTSAPLVAGAKTVTRRLWTAGHRRRFREGLVVDAYDRRPQFGGLHIARLRLKWDAYQEPMAAMPDTDYEAEGFAWLHTHPEHCPATINGSPSSHEDFSRAAFDAWRRSGGSMTVVRFELLEVLVPDYLEHVRQRLAVVRDRQRVRIRL